MVSLTLAEYLQLLDWIGRQIHRDGKCGVTPSNLQSLTEHWPQPRDVWVAMSRG